MRNMVYGALGALAIATAGPGVARADEVISVTLFPGAVASGNGATGFHRGHAWYGVPNTSNPALAQALLLAAEDGRTLDVYVAVGSYFSPCLKGQGNSGMIGDGSCFTIDGVGTPPSVP
jgi:hypothetical protein